MTEINQRRKFMIAAGIATSATVWNCSEQLIASDSPTKFKALIVKNYHELKSLNSNELNAGDVITVTDQSIGGDFVVRVSNKATPDDGGVIRVFNDIVNTSGKIIKYAERIFSGALNVQWFGAKGNGKDDDSRPIGHAIQALHKLTSHSNITTPFQSLYFPSGTYLIRNKLVIPKTATYAGFFGDSLNTSVLKFETNIGIELLAESTHWHDLTLLGNETTTLVSAQKHNGADIDFQFNQCKFSNAKIAVICRGRGAKFMNCVIDTADKGIFLQIRSPETIASNNSPWGNSYETAMRRYIVEGCDIDGVDTLVVVGPLSDEGIAAQADKFVHGITINGNHISALRRLIVGTSIRNSSISGNTMLSHRRRSAKADIPPGAPFIEVSIMENIIISNNVIRQQYHETMDWNDMRISRFVSVNNTGEESYVRNVIINDNIISDVTDSVFYSACPVDGVTIEGNSFPQLTVGSNTVSHILEVHNRAEHCQIIRNRTQIRIVPQQKPILAIVGDNVGSRNIIVEGNFIDVDHELLKFQ